MPTSPYYRCTVIVPVYNDWHLVPRLLACLGQQSIGTDAFQLLLVDNGSSHLPQLELPHYARLLRCNSPGSYAARNEGLAHAQSAIVAFTDADCRPTTHWLEHALACLEDARDHNCIVAGGIEVVSDSPQGPNKYELYDMALGLPQARYVRQGYAITANLFVPMEVFARVGKFDAARFSGGDAEFCRRAVQRGVTLRYCEQALVRHPARDSWIALASKVRRVKGGQVRHGSLRRRMIYFIRSFLPPVRAWFNVLRSARTENRHKLSICIIQARLWLVEMAEVLYLVLGRGERSRK